VGRSKRKASTLVEIEEPKERVLAVGVYTYGDENMQENFEEFKQLCEAANLDVVCEHLQKIQKPKGQYFIGPGRAEALSHITMEQDIDAVLLDCQLSPRQEFNLQELLGVKILDRTALILDIFARNARSKQAKIQVELAQLQYTKTRLKRMWTHLDRYKGGGVGSRGPGELQLETDKRLIGARIKHLEGVAKSILSQTGEQSKLRQDEFKVSLVGYTNAGKSSLLNTITGSDVFVKNQLFATLDTRTRKLGQKLVGKEVLISDTVGFIRRLPHSLVQSFHATLEEAIHADVLLHVVDATTNNLQIQIDSVDTVLSEIGVTNKTIIMVFNKMDMVEDHDSFRAIVSKYDNIALVSAKTGLGIDALLHRLQDEALKQVRENAR